MREGSRGSRSLGAAAGPFPDLIELQPSITQKVGAERVPSSGGEDWRSGISR